MPIGDWDITFTIRDSEQMTSDVVLHLDSSLSIGDLGNIASAFTPILTGLIDGVIEKVAGTKILDLDFTTIPGTETDVEQAAKFIWRITDSVKTLTQQIPTFKRSLLQAASNKVHVGNAAVITFIDAMTGAGIGTELTNVEANAPRDTENRLLGVLKAATEYWGRNRKR